MTLISKPEEQKFTVMYCIQEAIKTYGTAAYHSCGKACNEAYKLSIITSMHYTLKSRPRSSVSSFTFSCFTVSSKAKGLHYRK